MSRWPQVSRQSTPPHRAGLLLLLLLWAGATHAGALPEAAAPSPASPACVDPEDCRTTLARLRKAPGRASCEPVPLAEVARQACRLEVAEGCTVLGVELLRREPDGPSSAPRALFQRACERGDGAGCAWRALMELREAKEAEPRAQALWWLQVACDATPRAACGVGAWALHQDALRRGEPPEEELVALYAQRGCEAEDGASCRLLADAFLAGRGVAADTERALALYARGCALEDGAACLAEAQLTHQHGGPAAHVRERLERGCALGSAEACGGRVMMALQADEGAEAEALLFRQACATGAAVGCLALYDELRRRPEPRSALALPGLLKRACALGDEKTCGFLATVVRGAGQDCAAGHRDACVTMGVLLLSAPASSAEAEVGRGLLERACATGDSSSCGLLRTAALAQRDICGG